MPKIETSRSIEIAAPPASIFEHIIDFQKAQQWSPWIICEPSAELAIEGDSYTWNGELIGSGRVTRAQVIDNQQIRYHLEIHSPWKSVAEFSHTLEPVAGDAETPFTRVTWSMDSKLPWYLFFMKSMMQCMIGMDYQRGLRMLKDRVELGSVPCTLSYQDDEKIQECHYLGLERTCAMGDMERLMEPDFERMAKLFGEVGLHTEPIFTQYLKWNLGKGEATYVICCPVEKIPSAIPDGLVSGTRPACRTYCVNHLGPYRHLGNAWAAGMLRSRSKIFKQSRELSPFERYLNDPSCTPENDLITQVCFPIAD